MKNNQKIASRRTVAAILFLWGVFYFIAESIVYSMPVLNNVFPWIFYLCSFFLAFMLFKGEKHNGFLIVFAIQLLLSLRNLLNTFDLTRIIWLLADVVILVIGAYSLLPALSEKKNPLSGFEYVVIILELLPALLFFRNFRSYYLNTFINEIVYALALWFTARFLTDKSVSLELSSNADAALNSDIAVKVDDNKEDTPVPKTADAGPGVLLVRFSIDKLNELSGSYGFQSGRLIGKAVPAELLEGMIIKDGDSAATLSGQEYVCMVGISTLTNRADLKDKIEPLIVASEEIQAYGSYPLTQIVTNTNEPLVMDGIVRNGKIEGAGGWCASGMMSGWQESSKTAEDETESEKTVATDSLDMSHDSGSEHEPASWQPTNPQLASNMPVSSLLRAFIFKNSEEDVFSCPVAMGTLSDTIGAPVSEENCSLPVEVIVEKDARELIMSTGNLPPVCWEAMEKADEESVKLARSGKAKVCVRLFNNKNSGLSGAHVLLYEL